jgi:hypothetical protein
MPGAQEPKALFCVYRAGDPAITGYRGVANNPVQVGDFLSFVDLGASFE